MSPLLAAIAAGFLVLASILALVAIVKVAVDLITGRRWF